MVIHGIQKLTLIDYPEKTAATLFFKGCNFRCPYCHNASLVAEKALHDVLQGGQIAPALSPDQIFDFLKKRSSVLDGVCITGGEPLLQDGIEDFIFQIKNMGFDVKLDTNGQLPDKLKFLVQNKYVDYVAMDIKNSFKNYSKTIGIENFSTINVEKSADFLISTNVDYEFRTTVVREFHTADDFHSIGKRLRGARKYFLQQFKDSDTNISQGLHPCSKEQMQEFKGILASYIPSASLREI